jgi:predicted nucleic acid-binding protein
MEDNVLADINVCLDLLMDRKPFVEHSGQLFELAENGDIRLCISGLSFDTLFYVMRPAIGAKKSIAKLRLLRKHVIVAEVNTRVVDRALQSGWTDLEDALQYFCAVQNGCNYLVTRNKNDFKPGNESIMVVTPEEFV